MDTKDKAMKFLMILSPIEQVHKFSTAINFIFKDIMQFSFLHFFH